MAHPNLSLTLLPSNSEFSSGAPDIAATLPWSAGLGQLERVCTLRAETDKRLRSATSQACLQIACLIGNVGLFGVALPRGYEVRSVDREWIFVKCAAPGGEVEFVGSGQESLWTRLGLQADRPSDVQIRQLATDLETGLLQELVAFVETQSATQRQVLLVPESEMDVEVFVPANAVGESATRRRMQLVDLGRPTRRSNERISTRRRVVSGARA